MTSEPRDSYVENRRIYLQPCSDPTVRLVRLLGDDGPFVMEIACGCGFQGFELPEWAEVFEWHLHRAKGGNHEDR